MRSLDALYGFPLWVLGVTLLTGLAIGVLLGRRPTRSPSEEDGRMYSSREAYHAFSSLMLNTRRPTSEWINMGWWTPVNPDQQHEPDPSFQFPDAANQLARRVLACRDSDAEVVARSSTLAPPKQRPQQHVLDVGHGNGDSLLLISELFGPEALHGVTSLPAQAKRARERLASRAHVHCADAVEWLDQHVKGQTTYDTIVAIDCAYHFRDRQRFFQAAFHRLKPGGKLLLFDLFLAYPYPSTNTPSIHPCDFTPTPSAPSAVRMLKHSVTLALTGVPKQNLLPFEDYAFMLRTIGFELTMADVTSHVFPGFSRFLLSLGRGTERYWRGGSMLEQISLRLFGGVVDTWARGGAEGTIRAGLVRAVKPSSQALASASEAGE